MTLGALLLVVALIFPMSVAWFTNVARTGSVQFQAESWGFDADNITLTDPTVVMKPGDRGYASLRVDNAQGTGDIIATVYADKSEMTEAMQQRLFFYVDAAASDTFGEGENTYRESTARQYIASAEPFGYSYALAHGECLTLSETYCSDAPLKWEWVYDMEGYYFLGSVDETAVQVEEYLRPIEYELEQAVFSEEGQLERIGDMSVDEFLTALFDSDGYEGRFSGDYTDVRDGSDQEEAGYRRFYPVTVDEAGQGVWAYLCNEEDTRNAREYDNTQLGAGTMPVKITVVVHSVEQGEEAVDVSHAGQLLELLAPPEEGEGGKTLSVKLTEDLTVDLSSGTFPLRAGVDAVIDLDGYAIFCQGEEGDYNLFTVEEGAKLTLLNGEVRGLNADGEPSRTGGSGVRCEGGTVVLGGVRVRDFDTAVYVDDLTGGTGTVKITDCDFETAATAVLLYSSGTATAARSRVIVQNSTIRSDYIGISGQGSSSVGTELMVLDSTVEGRWAGLYHPQQGSYALISGSTISGYTGLVVKGGTVEVYASHVKGTGEYAPASENGGGFADTGGGVYVEAVYPWSATVILRGERNTVESAKGHGVELYGVSGKGPGRAQVEGGTITGGEGQQAYHWNGVGTFSVPEESETLTPTYAENGLEE